NSTDSVAALNDLPIKTIGHATVFLRDVAHVRDGYSVQTNSVAENGRPATLMTIRKTGGVSTLSVINGIRERLPDIEHLLPPGPPTACPSAPFPLTPAASPPPSTAS